LDVEKCERKSLKNIGEKKCSMTFHQLKKNNLDIDELSFRESCFSITMRSHDYTWNFLYPTTFEYSAAVIMSLKLQELMVYWEILMRTLETLRLVLIRLETLSVSIFLVVFQAY
jgi:hypothetical protein